MAGVQQHVYAALDQRFQGQVYSVGWRLHLSQSASGPGLHRSRSFVFQAMGAVAAHAIGAKTLYQCENGIASLCLPLVFGSFPWQTAKGVHPRFLHEMGSFLSLVLGESFRVENPYLLRTKAELCAAIRDASLEMAIGSAVSCDRFPQRLAGHPICGTCAPCILRRQSLHASDLARYDRTDLYRYDVTVPTTPIPRDARKAVDAMMGQQERLRQSLASAEPWVALTRFYPLLDSTKRYVAKATGISECRAEKEICSMLARYVQEWNSFHISLGFPDSKGIGDRRRVRSAEAPQSMLSLFDVLGPTC
jgi:hypothetical protein